MAGVTRLRLVPDPDALSRADLDQVRQHNLELTIAAVLARPRTARQWPGLARIGSVDELAALPLFTPDDLRRRCPPTDTDLILSDLDDGLVLRTSGTGGGSKVLYHSWEYYRRAAFLGGRGLRRALPSPARRIADCMHPAELTGAFLTVLEAARELPALCLPVGDQLPTSQLVALLAQHRVDTLVAAPMFLLDLVSDAEHRPALRTLRNLMFLGGPLSASMRHALTEALPEATIRSFGYATSEHGPVGYQCPVAGPATHHVHEDAFVVEVVDPRTSLPVPAGTVGEVVVTTLTDTGMPLFRYRVGDLGQVEPGRCGCGSHTLRLTLLGRGEESITIDTTTISRDLVMAELASIGLTDAADCQLQVLRDARGFSLHLLISTEADAGSAGELTADLVRERFGRQYHLNRVLTKPELREFAVHRVPPGRFHRNRRGKTPFFVERYERPN